MSKERELLERVLLNRHCIPIQIIYDINELLAKPEQEQELRVSVWLPFKKKEHGIGEDNDY
jgi:hypothetical protein